MKIAMTLLLLAGLTGCCCHRGAGASAPRTLFRVNVGADAPYVDNAGQTWAPDKEYAQGGGYGAVGGKTLVREEWVTPANVSNAEIYRSERFGLTEYHFEVPPGKYLVRLYFAEESKKVAGIGHRIFSVKINGQTILSDLDVMKEAGGFGMALVKEFPATAGEGGIVIEFVKKVQSPEINGIEVFKS